MVGQAPLCLNLVFMMMPNHRFSFQLINKVSSSASFEITGCHVRLVRWRNRRIGLKLPESRYIEVLTDYLFSYNRLSFNSCRFLRQRARPSQRAVGELLVCLT